MAFDPDTRREKAIAFASDVSRLLITLATAFVAFTVTFTDKVGGLVVQTGLANCLLIATWVVFAVSVGCGLWTQLALTQELEPKPGSTAAGRDPSIRARSVKVALASQIVAFVLATLLAVFFGMWRILEPVKPPEKRDASSPRGLVVVSIRLPAFASGSADVPEPAVTGAVCDARQKLRASGSVVAVVVGRHDDTRLRVHLVRRFGSNAGLAQQRAEYVARLLRDGGLCDSRESPAISQAIALAGPPRHVDRRLPAGDETRKAELEDDRRVEVYGLGDESKKPGAAASIGPAEKQ